MDDKTEVTKILLSKRDAALALSVSVRTIEHLLARKELSFRKLGKRTLIPRSALEAFARRNHDSPCPPRRSPAFRREAGAEAFSRE